MGEYPLNQPAARRATNDTVSAQKTARFMWGGEGVLAVAGGTWLAQIAPIGAPTSEIVGRSVVGGLGGLLTAILIIFVWNLFRAPYKQRNEARNLLSARRTRVPISNKNELVRAMSDVQTLSGQLLTAQELLDDLEATSPTLVHSDAIGKRDDSYAKYNEAMDKLCAEILVAGKPYESLLHDLSGYISTQVWVKMAKPTFSGATPQQARIRTALEYIGRIAGKVNEVRNKIDELTGQDHDKEDSQTE